MARGKLTAHNVIDLKEVKAWELIREATDLLLVGTEAERLAMKVQLEKAIREHEIVLMGH